LHRHVFVPERDRQGRATGAIDEGHRAPKAVDVLGLGHDGLPVVADVLVGLRRVALEHRHPSEHGFLLSASNGAGHPRPRSPSRQKATAASATSSAGWLRSATKVRARWPVTPRMAWLSRKGSRSRMRPSTMPSFTWRAVSATATS